MKKRILPFCLINVVLLVNLPGLAQIDSEKNTNTDSIGVIPACACDSLWKKANALEVVRLLEESTAGMAPVWRGYNLGDATFILNAGQTSKGLHCLGLWKKGIAVSYAQMSKTISMLTPIYSYYLNYKGVDSVPKSQYFTTAENAPAFKRWMDEMNVASAVYLLIDFSKLPFTVPSIVKVQIAIHEAFHVEVMFRYWFTKSGYWPKWDKQPDRQEVQSCYTYNDSARTFIQKELVILSDLVDALLDDKKEKTCSLGNAYMSARENRYKRLKNVKVKFEDGSRSDCRTAETIMELEEGLADYGSWTFLYNIGMVNKEELLKRYRARQNDHFYLSGCMLMHAISLMSKEPVKKIIDEIVMSASVEKGSLYYIFKNKLEEYCR